jgi:hypothetical protein
MLTQQNICEHFLVAYGQYVSCFSPVIGFWHKLQQAIALGSAGVICLVNFLLIKVLHYSTNFEKVFLFHVDADISFSLAAQHRTSSKKMVASASKLFVAQLINTAVVYLYTCLCICFVPSVCPFWEVCLSIYFVCQISTFTMLCRCWSCS